MPKVIVNGTEIDAPEGLNMIQVAKMLDIEIPHFCYHPGLGVDGNCRLCLIEVDGTPKPQIACNTYVREGLKIETETENIHKLRQAVLEFFFLNHPLDCPICDQAGECLLQDFYMRHGQYDSRLDLPKQHKRKVIEVGPRVVLDAERCVLCSRCVRFCDSVTGTGELRIINRGNHSEIGVFPGKPLDNPYSLNTVDLCPVGALTSIDFRFKCRVWYLSAANSICTGCSRGCNIYLEQNEGRVYRYRPRENAQVNQWWMCDDGRLTYKPINVDRCEVPLVEGKETPHSEALSGIVAAIKEATASGEPDAITVLLSADMANESLYAARKFATEVLGSKRIVAGSVKPPFVEDELLRKADPHPNRMGCETLSVWSDEMVSYLDKSGRLLIVIQNDLVDHQPETARLLAKYGKVIVFATNVNDTTRAANLVHPVTPHAESDGTFTNFQGRVQRFRKAKPALGDALPVMELLKRIAAGLGHEFGWINLNQIWKEMAETVREFDGISPSTVGDQGITIRSMRSGSSEAVGKGV